jgi:PadR family transcriptional regulator PadR
MALRPRAESGELLQGTLPLLILRVLSSGPNHGFAIARRIHVVSSETLKVEEGSLYPALHRMALAGWIVGDWGTTDNNRRARIYRLTRTGRRQLDRETDRWRAIAGGVAAVLAEG